MLAGFYLSTLIFAAKVNITQRRIYLKVHWNNKNIESNVFKRTERGKLNKFNSCVHFSEVWNKSIHQISDRGIFRTHSNICDGAFFTFSR